MTGIADRFYNCRTPVPDKLKFIFVMVGNDEAMLGDGVGGVERWPPIPAAAPGIPAIPGGVMVRRWCCDGAMIFTVMVQWGSSYWTGIIFEGEGPVTHRHCVCVF